jgi:hypothetical protein
MERIARNVRATSMLVAGAVLLSAARIANAADGWEDVAPYITDPFARWEAVGMTVLFAALIAVAGFKDSKRTRLE